MYLIFFETISFFLPWNSFLIWLHLHQKLLFFTQLIGQSLRPPISFFPLNLQGWHFIRSLTLPSSAPFPGNVWFSPPSNSTVDLVHGLNASNSSLLKQISSLLLQTCSWPGFSISINDTFDQYSSQCRILVITFDAFFYPQPHSITFHSLNFAHLSSYLTS